MDNRLREDVTFRLLQYNVDAVITGEEETKEDRIERVIVTIKGSGASIVALGEFIGGKHRPSIADSSALIRRIEEVTNLVAHNPFPSGESQTEDPQTRLVFLYDRSLFHCNHFSLSSYLGDNDNITLMGRFKLIGTDKHIVLVHNRVPRQPSDITYVMYIENLIHSFTYTYYGAVANNCPFIDEGGVKQLYVQYSHIPVEGYENKPYNKNKIPLVGCLIDYKGVARQRFVDFPFSRESPPPGRLTGCFEFVGRAYMEGMLVGVMEKANLPSGLAPCVTELRSERGKPDEFFKMLKCDS